DEGSDPVTDSFPVTDKGIMGHLFQCSPGSGDHLEIRVRSLKWSALARNDTQKQFLGRGSQKLPLFVSVGQDHIDARHEIGFLQLRRWLEFIQIDRPGFKE